MSVLLKRVRDLSKIVETGDFDNLQSWGYFLKLKLYEEEVMTNGIKYCKIFQSKDRIRFITTIPPLCEFGEFSHWHDCDELVEILGGQMANKLTRKHCGVGCKIIFPRYKKHNLFNPSKTEYCTLVVDFFKNHSI